MKELPQETQFMQKTEHQVTHKDFPILALAMTANFGDLLRYFKYYMGSGLIDATVERRVQRELAHKKDFPFRTFFSAVGVGIMVFMIVIAGLVFLQAAPAATSVAPSIPTLTG